MAMIDFLWALLVICALGQAAVIGTGFWLILTTFFEGREWRKNKK